jgi:hypothetical protein
MGQLLVTVWMQFNQEKNVAAKQSSLEQFRHV